MKVNNYLVTATDLATMGYTPKDGVTPPSGGGIMNKGEANFYYRIYNGEEPWASYSDQRCPKYQDFPTQCYAQVTISNVVAGNPDPVNYSYSDCSGNMFYGTLPFGQAIVITRCNPISGDSGPTTGCGILAGSVVSGGSIITYGSECDVPVSCVTTTTTTTTTAAPSTCYIVQGYVDGADINASYNFQVCFDWYDCSGVLISYCTIGEGGFTLPSDCYDPTYGAPIGYYYEYPGGPKITACCSYIDGTNPCGGITTTTTTTTIPPLGNTPFNAVAISDTDGQYQLAGNALKASTWQQGYLYVSNDYGVTFTKKNILGYWESVSVSANGQYMLAVENYGRAYRSTNYGVDWIVISNLSGPQGYPVSALQTLYFRGTAISETGQIQYICTKDIYYGVGSYYFALVLKSTDYGATWTTIKTIYAEYISVTLSSVATSSNGQYVYVASGDFNSYGTILVSNNAGSTWTETAGGVGNILDVSTTPDGEFVLAARFSNTNYTYLLSSTNYGVSFANITGTGGTAGPQDLWVKTCIQQASSPTDARGYALTSTNTLNAVVKATGLFTSSPINVNNTTSPSIKWRDIAVQRTSDRVLVASTTGLYQSTNPVSGTWVKIT